MWSPPVGSDLFNAFVSESLAWPASHFLLAHSICSKHLWPNYQTAWPHAICSPKREARAILRLQRRVIPALSCFVITIEIFNLGARNMLDQRVKWEIDWIKILKWRVISFPRIARRESQIYRYQYDPVCTYISLCIYIIYMHILCIYTRIYTCIVYISLFVYTHT